MQLEHDLISVSQVAVASLCSFRWALFSSLYRAETVQWGRHRKETASLPLLLSFSRPEMTSVCGFLIIAANFTSVSERARLAARRWPRLVSLLLYFVTSRRSIFRHKTAALHFQFPATNTVIAVRGSLLTVQDLSAEPLE